MSFLNALKQQAPNFNNKSVIQNNPTEAPENKPTFNDPIFVNINRVLSHNRLDVDFSRKPDQFVIDGLKQHDFWWNPKDKVWFHKDTEDNRKFLAEQFGATFIDAQANNATFTEEPIFQTVSDIENDAEAQSIEDQTLNDAEAQLIENQTLNDAETTQTYEVMPIDHPIETPEFTKYKNQVDALMQKLNLTAADLMVYAIDQLYRNTIAN